MFSLMSDQTDFMARLFINMFDYSFVWLVQKRIQASQQTILTEMENTVLLAHLTKLDLVKSHN